MFLNSVCFNAAWQYTRNFCKFNVVIVSVHNKRESEIPVILNVDSMNTVMDLFSDTAAILNSIVLNIYYGMF